MAPPTSYTEIALATYMDSLLGDLADVLGWAVGGVDAGSYKEPVNEALLALGVDDIGDVSGVEPCRRLRIIARREAWRAAVQAVASRYDVESDGQRFKRSQLQAMAAEALAIAEADALAVDPHYRVGVTRVTRKHDPYVYLTDDERTP